MELIDSFSELLSKELLSLKLKRELVPVVGAGLIIAGDICFKKSR